MKVKFIVDTESLRHPDLDVEIIRDFIITLCGSVEVEKEE